ncbi:TPA: hypothetical protein IAA82_04660 [Candidatus Galligastranaerophilus gallistercoris]|nr:hypothetical protein [Candidatus Galligastranaerophilus gallistercoris]
MEEKENLNFDFDPEFSEYNPIFAELHGLKEHIQSDEDTGFVASMIRKLMNPIVIVQIE